MKKTERFELKEKGLHLEAISTTEAMQLAIKYNPQLAEKFQGKCATATFTQWALSRCHAMSVPAFRKYWWCNFEIIAAAAPNRISEYRKKDFMMPEFDFQEIEQNNQIENKKQDLFFSIKVQNKF